MDIQYLKKKQQPGIQHCYSNTTVWLYQNYKNNSKKTGQSFGFWWMGVAAALWYGVVARYKREMMKEKKADKSFKPIFK